MRLLRTRPRAGPAPRPSFAFVGGEPCLDFINTVDWTPPRPRNERLGDYGAVVAWAERAGLLAPPTARRLRRRAANRPADAAAALARARALRARLQRVFAAVAGGHPPPPTDLDALNDALRHALTHLAIARGPANDRATLRWLWRDPVTDLTAPLWPVLRSAADLLTSDDVARLRMCAGADCGWLFVDRSRNGLRRWCEMRTCGARVKTRRYHARQARARRAARELSIRRATRRPRLARHVRG